MSVEDVYPSEGEQLAILSTIKRRYPMPKKSPKPYRSYDHWRISDWFHRKEACFFHLERGKHRANSMPEADFFSWDFTPENQVWLKVDRESHEMSEISKDDYDLTRGCRVNGRGIMEWAKVDAAGNVTWG